MTAFAHSTELATRFEAEALPLLDQLHRAAYRYTRHCADADADAEDLVQETLIRAWVGFASYTPGINIRAWMLRIMVNVAISTHRRVEGFKYREIASLMGTPVGTVMSRTHRGRRLLRTSLAEMAESHGYDFDADTTHADLNEVA